MRVALDRPTRVAMLGHETIDAFGRAVSFVHFLQRAVGEQRAVAHRYACTRALGQRKTGLRTSPVTATLVCASTVPLGAT